MGIARNYGADGPIPRDSDGGDPRSERIEEEKKKKESKT